MSASPKVPQHGGDVYHLARTLGIPLSDLLDFSANINPLGFPPGIPQAIHDALPEIIHYPDRTCWDLRQDLAAYHRLAPESILVGNGSTELIYLIARALRPRQALIVVPAFSEYEQALKAAQIPVDFYATSEANHFTLNQPLNLKGEGLVFLANPSSPCGTLLPRERLLAVVQALDAAGAYLLLDEAFVDFVEEASFKDQLTRFPRLMILRSFTKFFGIPGMRLGYLLAASELIAHLKEVQDPWSVNTLAQAMGRACLADLDFMAQTRALIAREGQYLFQRLAKIPGLAPFPSVVNYLLVKITLPGWTAARLRTALLAQKIIIRDASNFRGLDQGYFRVAVRGRKENDRLLNGLERCLDGG